MSKVKQHPLDVDYISELEGSSQPLTFYSKGHHDLKDFIEALDHEFGEDYGSGEHAALEFVEKYCRHTYARVCPWQGSNAYQYLPASKGERGAFPVTEYDYDRHLSDWHREENEKKAG